MGPPPLSDDRSEIVFFDVETTVPTRTGQGFAILEFGAILVCPRKLTELRNYSTLVRPANLSLISPLSERCNGINAAAVSTAPTFADIANTVYDLLHGSFKFLFLFIIQKNVGVFYLMLVNLFFYLFREDLGGS